MTGTGGAPRVELLFHTDDLAGVNDHFGCLLFHPDGVLAERAGSRTWLYTGSLENERWVTYARELDLDMAKISITIPLPGTPLYQEIEREGRLLTKHWSEYNLYRPARTVYRHDTLAWDVIEKHYRRFYRSFYLRPGYALRRLRYALRNRTLLTDLRALFHTDW